jgi:hypothetical protein
VGDRPDADVEPVGVAAGGGDGRPGGRVVLEVARRHLEHVAHLADVCLEGDDVDHIVQPAARRLEHGLEPVECARGLRSDVARVERAARRVRAQLS